MATKTEYVPPVKMLRQALNLVAGHKKKRERRVQEIHEAFVPWFVKTYLQRFPLPIREISKEDCVHFEAEYPLTQEEFENLRYVFWCLDVYWRSERDGSWIGMCGTWNALVVIESEEKEPTCRYANRALRITAEIPNTRTRGEHSREIKLVDDNGKFKGKLRVKGSLWLPLGEQLLVDRYGCSLNGPEAAAQSARQIEIDHAKQGVTVAEESVASHAERLARLKKINESLR
jgi:hypothetical protein